MELGKLLVFFGMLLVVAGIVVMLLGRVVPLLVLWWMAETTADADLAVG